MTDRLAAEMLSQYLDHLFAGRDDLEAFVQLGVHRDREIHALLAFARHLATLLVPVAPGEQFAESLRTRLLAAPGQALGMPAVKAGPGAAYAPPIFTRGRVLYGAAALGSVAAVILVLMRGRVLGARAA